MAQKRDGLLAQIEAGVIDDKTSLSSLLQKCIVLGGQAGSEKMRDWARRELNGYRGDETVPEYRHIRAALMAQVTNRAGYNGILQRVHLSVFPREIQTMISEKLELEDAILGGGIGELEALAGMDKEEHQLMPSWAGFIVDALNTFNMPPNSVTIGVYWSVSNASVRGLLVGVRTALAELVAELIAATPEGREVPDKRSADEAVQLVVTGNRNTVIVQHSTDGGSNLAVDGAVSGPAVASGAASTTIGSQAANGTNASVVGSTTVSGDRNTVAGRDAITNEAQPSEDRGWWSRLRKRGVIVAISTIAAGVLAFFTWIGWSPSQNSSPPQPLPSVTSTSPR